MCSGTTLRQSSFDREILRELARCFARAAVDEMLNSPEAKKAEGGACAGTRLCAEPRHIDRVSG